MIKTTHIGSLPFKDLDQALDFNKQFYLPVLSTLPNLNPKEFMVEQILDGIEGVHFENFNLYLPDFLKLDPIKFTFSLEKKFIETFRGREIKWQILGIVTLLKLCKTWPSKFFVEKLIDWHADNVNSYQSLLSEKFSKVILFLDEPMLQTKEELIYLSKFIKKLNFHNIVIHNCSKFDPIIFDEIKYEVGLSFDLRNINPDRFEFISQHFKSLYLGLLDVKSDSLVDLPKDFFGSDIYVTPSCGMVFCDASHVLNVPNILGLKFK